MSSVPLSALLLDPSSSTPSSYDGDTLVSFLIRWRSAFDNDVMSVIDQCREIFVSRRETVREFLAGNKQALPVSPKEWYCDINILDGAISKLSVAGDQIHRFAEYCPEYIDSMSVSEHFATLFHVIFEIYKIKNYIESTMSFDSVTRYNDCPYITESTTDTRETVYHFSRIINKLQIAANNLIAFEQSTRRNLMPSHQHYIRFCSSFSPKLFALGDDIEQSTSFYNFMDSNAGNRPDDIWAMSIGSSAFYYWTVDNGKKCKNAVDAKYEIRRLIGKIEDIKHDRCRV